MSNQVVRTKRGIFIIPSEDPYVWREAEQHPQTAGRKPVIDPDLKQVILNGQPGTQVFLTVPEDRSPNQISVAAHKFFKYRGVSISTEERKTFVIVTRKP